MPGGVPATGLHITEIMAAPDSPEPAWEWVEIFNNTGNTINFASQHYVLHDDDGADFSNANVTSGLLPQGGVAVLFNGVANTTVKMDFIFTSYSLSHSVLCKDAQNFSSLTIQYASPP